MQVRPFFSFSLVSLFVSLPSIILATPFVTARLWGQLGNQFFIIAAATSLALDNGAEAIFPDLVDASDPNAGLKINYHLASLRTNYTKIFPHINVSRPSEPISFVYREPHFTYNPIPYQPNMMLEGWFQSEKYFAHHKQEIIELFAPQIEILEYLNEHYAEIIGHPKTVSIHLRYYLKEDPKQVVYITYGRDYVEKAMALFPEDSLFVVFSDNMPWCKKELEGIQRELFFIEDKPYHDLYLMSLCKHNIICNSSFSWWAAYMNLNPNKIVVTPPEWFNPLYNHVTKDLIPNDWLVLSEGTK